MPIINPELCRKDKGHFINEYVPLYTPTFGYKTHSLSPCQLKLIGMIQDGPTYTNIDYGLPYDDNLNIMIGCIVHNLILNPNSIIGFITNNHTNRKMIIGRLEESLVKFLENDNYGYVNVREWAESIIKEHVVGIITPSGARGYAFREIYCIEHTTKWPFEEFLRWLLPTAEHMGSKIINLCNTTKIV